MKAFFGVEIARIDLSDEDKQFFRDILDEMEKEKVKIETKLKMIEKLKAKGLSEEEIMELLKDD